MNAVVFFTSIVKFPAFQLVSFMPYTYTELDSPRDDMTCHKTGNVISVGHEGDQIKIWKIYYVCKKGSCIHPWPQI